MDTNKITIYIPLLDEGVKVSRPTLAEEVRKGVYKVLATEDYDPEDEIWEFPPGSIVKCDREIKDGEEVLTASSQVQNLK